MKLFIPTDLNGEYLPADRGYGHLWDSLTGNVQELNWDVPDDGGVWYQAVPDGMRAIGLSTFSGEVGTDRVNRLFTAPAGTVPSGVTVVDADELFVRNDQFATGNYLVSTATRYTTRYLMVDFSADAAVGVMADATDWIRPDAANGTVFVIPMRSGPPRLGNMLMSGTDVRLLVSSPADGSPMVVALDTLLPNPPPMAVEDVTPENIYKFVAAGTASLRKVLEPLGAAGTLTVILLYAEGIGTQFITLPRMWGVFGGDTDVSEGLLPDLFGGGLATAMRITASKDGTVTSLETFSPPDVYLGRTLPDVYPDFDLTPPAVPPFWRGFIKAYETI